METNKGKEEPTIFKDLAGFERFLVSALRQFYRKDKELILYGKTIAPERTVMFRLALALHNELEAYSFNDDLTIDCESNRLTGWDVDRSFRLPSSISSVSEIVPDIICHQRGCRTNNLFAIELKLTGKTNRSVNDKDRRKLEVLTDERYYGYRFGARIVLCSTQAKLDLYEHGTLVHKIIENTLDTGNRASGSSNPRSALPGTPAVGSWWQAPRHP